MHDPLAPLLAEGVIDEILTRLKSGKEADLWLVRHGQEIVAAKVYKERLTRSFKNNSAYREGRQVRNSRTQRAMDRGSRFGQAAAEEAWKAKEADALHALHAAGVRVPRPVVFYEGVLLMELVLDPFGHPAPRLIDAHVTREHAAALYQDLRSQAVKMLCCDLIHGDLSPYNVLAGRDGPVVIDFPQVIGAAHNSQAERFFHRDLENLRRFFEAIDPALRVHAGDAKEIWRTYERRELTPGFEPTGRHVEPPRQGRSERSRPEHGRPEHGRTEHGRPEHGRPEHGRPEHGRPEHGRPEHGRTEHGRPEHGRTEHGRSQPSPPPGAPPLQGKRPDHRAGQDRREQRGAPDRADRRDQRERGSPPRPPRDGSRRQPDRAPRREPSQPEVVRVARPPSGSGPTTPPGQPRQVVPGQPGGQAPGQRQGAGQGQGPGQPGGPGRKRSGRRGRRR
jgi:RIO kinase 1